MNEMMNTMVDTTTTTALQNEVSAERHDLTRDLAPAVIGALIGLGAAYLVHKYRESQEEKEVK